MEDETTTPEPAPVALAIACVLFVLWRTRRRYARELRAFAAGHQQGYRLGKGTALESLLLRLDAVELDAP